MEVKNARFDENVDKLPADAQKSEDHKKLLDYGIHESVADRLDEIYRSGKTEFRFNFYPLRFLIVPGYILIQNIAMHMRRKILFVLKESDVL